MGEGARRCRFRGFSLALMLALFAVGSARAESRATQQESAEAAEPRTDAPADAAAPSTIEVPENTTEDAAEDAAPSKRRGAFALDLFRLGFPSGLGVGFRYLPLPELAFEAGVSTIVLATGIDLSIAAFPAPGGVQRRANFLMRFGYRTASLHGLADRMIVLVVPAFPGEGQLSISGAHLGFIHMQIGASYRASGPLLFEMSLGYMIQLGEATSRVGGRAAISQTGARFPIGELRLSYLFDRRRR